MSAHDTHCCPVHGCKYGNDMEIVQEKFNEPPCPISTGERKPRYGSNNGCEACEWDREWDRKQETEWMERFGIRKVYNVGIQRPDGSCFSTSISEVGHSDKAAAEKALKRANDERMGDVVTYVLLSRYTSDWQVDAN